MHYDEIRRWLRAVPFKPFQLRLSNGETYDITHPELVGFGRMTVDVGIPIQDPQYPPYVRDRVVTVSILHVAELIPLSTPSTPEGNGVVN